MYLICCTSNANDYLDGGTGKADLSGGDDETVYTIAEDDVLLYVSSGNIGNWNDIGTGPNANIGSLVELEEAPALPGVVDIDVLSNDTDVDNGAVLTVASVDAVSASGATLSLNGDGTVKYVATAQATISVTVTGTNDAPSLAAGVAAAVEDGPTVDVDLTALGADVDSDDDGSSLTYTVSGAPSEGSATFIGATLTFDPGADFQNLALNETRDVTIQVTAMDAHGATAVNDVVVTVTGTNDAPEFTVGDFSGGVTEAVPGIASGSVAEPSGLTFTDTSNITLANAQIESGSDASSNPDVINAPTGQSLSYTASGLFNTFGTGTYGAHNLNDGDVGASPTNQDGYYAIPNAGPNSLVLDLGGTQTLTSIAIYNGYGNRTDGDYTLRDGDGNVLGSWTVSGTTGYTNNGVHSFWLTFDAPVTTDRLVFDTTNADPDAGQYTNSYREIQIFGEPVLADEGTLAFEDVDLSDTHTVGVVETEAGYLGAMTVSLADPSTGDGAGAVDWNFAVADSLVDHLGEGQVLTQTYEVTVDDGNGGTDTQTVTIDITGTNDAPVITSGSQLVGAVVEAGNLDDGTGVGGTASATGTMVSTDVDTGATATWSGDAAGAYGAFAIDPSTGAWTYTLDNANPATNALAEGQVETETFTVTVTDEHNATATEVVTITVSGTNDSPVASDDTLVSGPADPTGWTYNADNGHYYQVVDTGSTFAQAFAGADALGGYLATITTANEQAFIEANGLIAVTDGTWIGGQSSNPANDTDVDTGTVLSVALLDQPLRAARRFP